MQHKHKSEVQKSYKIRKKWRNNKAIATVNKSKKNGK